MIQSQTLDISDLDVAISEIEALEKRNKVLSHNLETANDIIITMQEEITKLQKLKNVSLEMVYALIMALCNDEQLAEERKKSMRSQHEIIQYKKELERCVREIASLRCVLDWIEYSVIIIVFRNAQTANEDAEP